MCGILGVATAGVDPPQGLVAGGLKYLEHRGPEAATQVLVRSGDRACVLGHTRLRIIDLREEADQPAQNEDGSVQVVFNGELYNFKELRAELQAKGHSFSSNADTEVLAHLYEVTEGDMQAMLDRLRGMFAFALWDNRRGRLVLARDRLGIKPMYFAALPGRGIAFGSESGALVRSGLFDAGPDTASILGYLMWGSVQGPRSILGGVQELQPGRYLRWEESGHEERVWWEPAFEPRLDRDSSVERLRGALGDAVQRHLVADREVGLFLSGGVDSGAIAHTAAREGALRSLTVTFPEVVGDEGERAAGVAAELGLHHETVPVLGSELAAVLPTIAAAMDQPTADGVNSWVVSRAAHQAGLVVALSGVGGDELFGGYPSFKLVPRVAAAGKALRMLPRAARRAVADAIVSRRPVSPGSRVVMTGPGFGGAYRAVRGLFGLRDLENLGALRWVGERDAIELFTPPSPRETSPGDAVALLELQRYLRNQLLRDTDAMSMAHSLEVRVPLLDDAVVQTALSIPADIRNQRGKRLLQAAAGFSLGAPKEGFTLPFGSWMHGPLREPVRELVLSNDLPLGWLMAPDARRGLWQAFEERRVHWSRPWAIGMLRLWADTHGYRW